MKYTLTTLATITLSFFVYWLGGGDFDRGHALGFAMCVGLILSIALCTLIWFSDNSLKVRRR